MTHVTHKEGDILQIYFCVTFHEIRHHTQAHVTSGALIHCALSSAARRTQTAAQVNDFAGHCLLWRLLLLLASAPDTGVSNQNFTVGFLLKFYFFRAIA